MQIDPFGYKNKPKKPNSQTFSLDFAGHFPYLMCDDAFKGEKKRNVLLFIKRKTKFMQIRFMNYLPINNLASLREAEGRIAAAIITSSWTHSFTTHTYDKVDGYATGVTGTLIVEEIKAYTDLDYPRNHDKYRNYRIDYAKLLEVKTRAVNGQGESEKRGLRRRPLLLAFFTDALYIWDLDKSPWESTGEWVETNDKGVDYGLSSSWSYQATLEFDDAIYHKDLPYDFWQQVRDIIREFYPTIDADEKRWKEEQRKKN